MRFADWVAPVMFAGSIWASSTGEWFGAIWLVLTAILVELVQFKFDYRTRDNDTHD